MSRGINRERQVRKALEAEGYWTCRAAGSFGDADVVALKAGQVPMMIEVKSTARGPWEHFGPKDRAELEAAARVAGAVPWLVWWPSRGDAQWIHRDFWPKVRP